MRVVVDAGRAEERLDETEMVPWAKSDQQFDFIRSQIVIFSTEASIRTPAELAAATR